MLVYKYLQNAIVNITSADPARMESCAKKEWNFIDEGIVVVMSGVRGHQGQKMQLLMNCVPKVSSNDS